MVLVPLGVRVLDQPLELKVCGLRLRVLQLQNCPQHITIVTTMFWLAYRKYSGPSLRPTSKLL